MTVVCTTVQTAGPVPATPATLLTDYQLGWTASAQSIATLYQDGYYYFTPNSASLGIVSGLTRSAIDSGYWDIEFGFYINKGKVLVIESGVIRTSFTSAPDLPLMIQRAGGVVTYYVNGTLVYTSTRASTSPLVADVSFYSAGDSISAAAIVPENSSFNDLAPLVPFGGSIGHGAYAELLPLIAVAPVQNNSANLAKLTTFGGEGTYAVAVNQLQALTTSISFGMIVPEYAVSAAALPYLHTIAHGITGIVGDVSADLAPLQTLSADHAYGISVNNLRPLENMAGAAYPIDSYLMADLPGGYQLTAGMTEQVPNTFAGSMPMPTLRAYTGAEAKLTLPMPTLLATGTGTVIGRARLTLPMPTLIASATTGAVSRAELTLSDSFTLSAFTGSVVAITLQDGFVVTASGTTGAVSRATLTMPLFELTASATANDTMRAALTMPMLRPVPSGIARLVMPGFVLTAAGTATVAITYEAYAVNLLAGEGQPNQATHYTNFPFNQIVRFNGNHYGVADDGLYLLAGDLDIAAPIAWEWETCLSDFGAKEFKRAVSIYAGGRIDGEADFKVVAGEDSEQQYHYRAVRGKTAQTYRAKFGKGLESRYYAFGLADPQGGFFEVDTLDPEIEQLKRSI